MTRFIFLLAVALAPVGCTSEPATPAATPSRTAEPTTSPSPGDALDGLDARTPVPLLPMMANHQKQNMRDHLVPVQEIVAALASEDFTGVEKAAGRIGFSEQMGQMCTHLGAGAPGFTERALEFHHTADRIAVAARERDKTRVLSELGVTLSTCTSCHATWKQQVVDEPTWQKLTSSAAPTHSGVH